MPRHKDLMLAVRAGLSAVGLDKINEEFENALSQSPVNSFAEEIKRADDMRITQSGRELDEIEYSRIKSGVFLNGTKNRCKTEKQRSNEISKRRKKNKNKKTHRK